MALNHVHKLRQYFLYSRRVSTASFVPDVRDLLPPGTHEQIYNYSIQKSDNFWKPIAESSILWSKPFEHVADHDLSLGQINWFPGGNLNASVNLVDRHAERFPNKTALIWEKDEQGSTEFLSYKELQDLVNKIGNLLRFHGVYKRDVVTLYMPVSCMAVAVMLACSRIGAVHNVVFAGFSAEALTARIQDSKSKVVFTADESLRGGKTIPLKAIVDQACSNLDCVKNIFVMSRTGAPVKMTFKDIRLEESLREMSVVCVPETMKSNDPLFILYTSGSTGSPKGLLHSTAGYLLFSSFTLQVAFNYHSEDIFGCVADIGWITGHSYVVYGPLMVGGTTVLFESTPTYPDPGRYWEMVERLKVTQFYGSPTALRLLMTYSKDYVRKYDRSSLRVLGSVGEPINVSTWNWYYNVVGDGRCDLVDTWWQTETGGICISPRPSKNEDPILPCMAMRPMFGIHPVLLNSQGQRIKEKNVTGSLCLKTPWPGMAISILGDHQRFVNTYFSPFPGYYCTGDEALQDSDSYWKITGRNDDVINVSGHRLGTMEVESSLCKHESVVEAAVIGVPNEMKGESVYAFVVLTETVQQSASKKEIEKQLKALVRETITGFAVPDVIQFCDDLPKTRSGKITRRILRKIAMGEHDNLGDVSILMNPSTLVNLLKNKY